jgi:hypothetical protein
MKRYAALTACALWLSLGLLQAETVGPDGPVVSQPGKVCGGDPSGTGPNCPPQDRAASDNSQQGLQRCMAGAKNTMQGYRARYLLCRSGTAERTRAGNP